MPFHKYEKNDPEYLFTELKQFREENSEGARAPKGSSSEEERKVNALASGADEGRD